MLAHSRHDPDSRHNDVLAYARAELTRVVSDAAQPPTPPQNHQQDYRDFKYDTETLFMALSVELADVPSRLKDPLFEEHALTVGAAGGTPTSKEIYLLDCLVGGSLTEAELTSPIGKHINRLVVACARAEFFTGALRLLTLTARGTVSTTAVEGYVTECMAVLLGAHDLKPLIGLTLVATATFAPKQLQGATEAARYSPTMRELTVDYLVSKGAAELGQHEIWILGTMFLARSAFTAPATATRLAGLVTEPPRVVVTDPLMEISKKIGKQFAISSLPWSADLRAQNEANASALLTQALGVWFAKRPLALPQWTDFASATSTFVCVVCNLVEIHPLFVESEWFQRSLEGFLRAAPPDRPLCAPVLDNIAGLCRSPRAVKLLQERAEIEVRMIVNPPRSLTENDAEAESNEDDPIAKLSTEEYLDEVRKLLGQVATHLHPNRRRSVLEATISEDEVSGIEDFVGGAALFQRQSQALLKTIVIALDDLGREGAVQSLTDAVKKLRYAAKIRGNIWHNIAIKEFTKLLRIEGGLDSSRRYSIAAALIYDSSFTPVRWVGKPTLVGLAGKLVGPVAGLSVQEPNRRSGAYFAAKRDLLRGELLKGISELRRIILAKEASPKLRRACLEYGLERLCCLGAYEEAALFLTSATKESATYSKKELSTAATPRRAVDWMLVGYVHLGFSVATNPPEFSGEATTHHPRDAKVGSALVAAAAEVEKLSEHQRRNLLRGRPLFGIELCVLRAIATQTICWSDAVKGIASLALQLTGTQNQIFAALLLVDASDFLIARRGPNDAEGARLLATFAYSKLVSRAAAEAELGSSLDWQVRTLHTRVATAVVASLKDSVGGESLAPWVDMYRQASAHLAREHGETELMELIQIREEFAPDLRAWEVVS